MLSSLLKTHFGYDQFRPLQEEIISEVLAGRDAFVLMPTGGGKSLCYQLPALVLPGLTLVISPLIALMKDQVDALRVNGLAAESIHSGLSGSEIQAIQKKAQLGELKLLYVSPERLALASFQKFLASLTISLLAIDEAHCISEWGHDFRPDYRTLKKVRENYPELPVIALTATATQLVQQDIIKQLGLEKAKVLLSTFNRPNLSYAVRPKQDTFKALLGLLREIPKESVIIYCFSRKDVEKLSKDLEKQGIVAVPYHAGLSAEDRQKNQESFIRDEVRVVVATIAFGMGIDKPDIRLVVHYDLPKSLEGYYQETGRAGRDGLPSRCVLFYSYGDSLKQTFFIDQLTDREERQRAQLKLNQVLEFCQLRQCRRAYLLRYFNEDWSDQNCRSCDNCLTPQEFIDATQIAKKILSAVLRTGERFGTGLVTEVLLGAPAVLKKQPWTERLSVFGIVQDFSGEELKHLIRSLVEAGLLIRNEGEYPTLAVSQTGKQFLVGKTTLDLPRPPRDIPRNKLLKGKLAKKGGELRYDEPLFEALRALRKRLADELGVPPFIVFGDISLRQMATLKPQNEEEFSRISGVGEKKLAQFSKSFLEVLKNS